MTPRRSTAQTAVKRQEVLQQLPAFSANGYRFTPLAVEDGPFVARLAMLAGNLFVPATAEITRNSAEGLITALQSQMWALPMKCDRRGREVGISYLQGVDLMHLHASLHGIFVEPATAVGPLRHYLQLVWASFPLHRLYAELPASIPDYVELYREVGFHDEGILRSYARVGEGSIDIVSLGMLREDFKALTRMPRS
jgi:hypothetical protein